jgi:predicted O-methyltransferase YrrM
MSNRSIGLNDALYQYLLSVSLREPAVLKELRERTAQLPTAGMQISPEQGQFMHWLVATMGARRTLEVGVFTGYSALATALALPPDGQLIALDISAEYTDIARPFWQRAGVADRIQLRLGPALQSLQALIDRGESGKFDFAFIDADKENYEPYYEGALRLLRSGGVIAVDNVLWDGRVLDPAINDSSTVAVRAFNQKIAKDNRVAISMLPIGDGLSLLRKL